MRSIPGTFELCDCEWLYPDNPEIDGGSTPCGCGQADCRARLFRDQVIHWEGKHWRILCAFREALRRLESLEKASQPTLNTTNP